MNNIFKTASVCLLLLVATLTSCTKSEEIFGGDDNFVVSFVLTQNSTQYKAAIVGNKIVVTAPSNVSLTNAQVECQLSEKSTIIPNPSEVTNWDESQLFRVESQNGAYTSYIYSVQRAAISNENDICLLSQEDVEEFASKGVNRVDGDLIIGSTAKVADDKSEISSLESLKAITSVKNNLVINSSFGAGSLKGLENLKEVGSIIIGSKSVASALDSTLNIELPSLEKASQIVINSDSLLGLSMPKLKEVGNLYVNSMRVNSVDLSSVESAFGDFTFEGTRGTNISTINNNLSELKLPNLKTVGGNLIIKNLWKVSSFDLSELETVGGALKIHSLRAIPTLVMPNLTKVSADFYIYDCELMKSIKCESLVSTGKFDLYALNAYSLNLQYVEFPELKNVDGDMTFKYAAVVDAKFESLESVAGKLTISDMMKVETFTLPSLTSIEAGEFKNTKLVKSIDISNLTTSPALTIGGCTTLESVYTPKTVASFALMGGLGVNVPKFEGLKTVEGEFKITSFTDSVKIGSIASAGKITCATMTKVPYFELSDIEEIGDLTVSAMDVATTFAMPKLKKVENFTMKSLYKLENLEIPNLKAIYGKLSYWGATSAYYASKNMTDNLDAFKNVIEVGTVEIKNFKLLKDFTPFKYIAFALDGEENWIVVGCGYNPTYQDMIDLKLTEPVVE